MISSEILWETTINRMAAHVSKTLSPTFDNRKNSESLTNDLVDMVRDHSLDMSLNSDKKVVTH